MKFSVNPPSLKHIALVKLAISMWSQKDIKDLASKDIPYDHLHWNEYRGTEDNVMVKINKLALPEVLKEELPNFIRPIGWQIWTWLYHREKFCLKSPHLKPAVKNFFWTLRGTLDTKKIMEYLVENEDLDLEGRREMAGIYFLEDAYDRLSRKLNEVHGLQNIEANDASFALFSKSCLQEEFLLIESDDFMFPASTYTHDTASVNEYMFICAALTANEAATKYMLQKLTPEEKEKTLAKTASYVIAKRFCSTATYPYIRKCRLTNILCYLLSVMSEEQRMSVCKSNLHSLLMCLLDFPWQYLFLDVLDHVEIFLDAKKYFGLVHSICNKMELVDDYDYENLLRIFWQKIPDDVKKEWLPDIIFKLCSRLSQCADDKVVLQILDDIFRLSGNEFMFEAVGMDICEILIRRNRWVAFSLLLQKSTLSKDSLVKFKEQLHTFLNAAQPIEIRKTNKAAQEKSFAIIDECIQKSFDEEDQSAKLSCRTSLN